MIFSNDGYNKNIFHKRKQPIEINKVDINKVEKSDKDSHSGKGSFKYFIEHKSNNDIRPLCIKLPQMNRCARYFVSGIKYINFLVNGKKIVKSI